MKKKYEKPSVSAFKIVTDVITESGLNENSFGLEEVDVSDMYRQ